MTRPMIGTIFDIDEPRARRSDPLESHEAADTSDVEKSIGLVLDILTRFGPLADFEIERWADAGYASNFTGQRLRTARAALVKKGLVAATGEKTRTPLGRRTNLWTVA